MTSLPHSAFTPPSPGAWELEQTHMTRVPSRFILSTLPEPMMAGFKAGSRAYGVLLDHLELADINGFPYTAPRAVGAPKSAKGTPPRWLFSLLVRVHPEIRRRVRRAAEVFRDRSWQNDIRWWDQELKPAMRKKAQVLLSENLSDASDAQLADHVRRATEFLREATFNHHRMNFCAMLPVGDFLVRAMDWTGLSAGELLRAMAGLSPVSAGAVAELTELRRAILTDSSAMALVTSARPDAEVLTQLQAREGAVGEAARAYIAAVGLRVLGGYDVADRHAREHPELLMKIIRAAVVSDDATRQAAAEQAIDRIRARVPPAHHAEFDEALREAQASYRIRDERVFHGDAMAVGIARRAILAAGERLAGRGAVAEAEHLIDATPSEIISLLEGRGGPAAAELAERARWRRDTPITAAPARLGHEPSPPPPAEWLPPAAARVQRITTLILSLMFDVRAADAGTQQQLKGFGVSSGVYEGPVRLIRNVEELHLVQRGEVLVTSSTGPTFNVILPLIGALVTERGGVLSHAAIVSREYGLPGVVGCTGATTKLTTGTRVRVDGDKGEVWTIG